MTKKEKCNGNHDGYSIIITFLLLGFLLLLAAGYNENMKVKQLGQSICDETYGKEKSDFYYYDKSEKLVKCKTYENRIPFDGIHVKGVKS